MNASNSAVVSLSPIVVNTSRAVLTGMNPLLAVLSASTAKASVIVFGGAIRGDRPVIICIN